MSSRRKFLRNISVAAAAAMTTRLGAKNSFADLPADPNIILPPRLQKGDLIALSAPAGAIWNEDSIQKATLALEGAGFLVKHCDSLSMKYGYLAGDDDFRTAEWNDLFQDEAVKGIVCMRGGWGCARIAKNLHLDMLAHNPKVITGFSDFTTLLVGIYARTGLITFHGPVGNSSWNDFTLDHFLRVVVEGEAIKMQQPSTDPLTIYKEGKAHGRLIGGNLTVFNTMMGTGFLPDLNNTILFLEDTEEEPYAIDRMFTQLELCRITTSAAAILLGKFTDCVAEEPIKSFPIDEVLKQKVGGSLVPAASGFNFGHIADKFTIPVGALATFDTSDQSLTLDYPCVS
ncbi:MAG TPA: LD-carboxypeptidase [Bacteroidia bacterium]|jgi:muramoyltetrapeptide carboxypeptidase|nr:LD-carboxypeptidase [Bacteroidia bacterium]